MECSWFPNVWSSQTQQIWVKEILSQFSTNFQDILHTQFSIHVVFTLKILRCFDHGYVRMSFVWKLTENLVKTIHHVKPTLSVKNIKRWFQMVFIMSWLMKWNKSGFMPPLCTYRLNWAKRTSWGWWDEWDDNVLQTQDSKFEPWRSEAEHATSRSRRLPTILSFTSGLGRIFLFLSNRRGQESNPELLWQAPWPRGNVFDLKPPGLEFRILCLEGSVISFISPVFQAQFSPYMPKTPFILFTTWQFRLFNPLTTDTDYILFSHFLWPYYIIAAVKYVKMLNVKSINKISESLTLPNLNNFSHLTCMWLALAKHNFKWVKIPIYS